MRESRLLEGGENLFQKIKEVCIKVEEKGIKLYKLSIGQPTGPALFSARRAAANAVLSEDESMHEYQDNGSVGVPNFPEEFIFAHTETLDLGDAYYNQGTIDLLPTPGIKPMLGLVPMACGGINGNRIIVGTMTDPGYPTPKDWCDLTNQIHYSLSTNSRNSFRFTADDVRQDSDLIMINYPHNPSGQIVTRKWLEKICRFCQENNIRIFNDAAYAMLVHSKESCTLTDVAMYLPDLSWAEAFSASKNIGNGTGWRVGAMCGSPDFIGDIKKIKGNTDSGHAAFAAAGVFEAVRYDMDSIEGYRKMYASRMKTLITILQEHGMKLAVQPSAGFFTLWKVPKTAFEQKITSAEHFNFLMIEKTGIVGVHFKPDYIRYAVVAPVKSSEYKDAIHNGFREAKVSY